MLPVKLFFYFNGFNSAILDDFSGNPKIVAVAEFAVGRGYRFLPISVCYRQAREQAREILERVDGSAVEVVFCGSSMGGWFARILQLMLQRERTEIRTAAVGFNPAFSLGIYGNMLLGPQRNYVTQEDYEWTADHTRELQALEADIDYRAKLPFFVYLDKADEVIDWELSAASHAPISRLICFEGGCHSFDHYREALADFAAEFIG